MVFQGCTFCWPPLYLEPRFLRPTSNLGKERWAKLGQLLMIMVANGGHHEEDSTTIVANTLWKVVKQNNIINNERTYICYSLTCGYTCNIFH